MTARIDYKNGTLEIRGVADAMSLPDACLWDERSACYRAPGNAYAEIVMAFVRQKCPYNDGARSYDELESGLRVRREPRPYQVQAVAAWERAGGQGIIVLPTGSGKSHVALMAMDRKRRSTLVVVPTLDLVRQWYDLIRTSFGVSVGIVGGGEYNVDRITVTTYDSAYLHMEHFGNRFGLVVFDECHHLPGESYALAAQFCLAPYRMGLTATPERQDGRHDAFEALVGPLVYRRDIVEMTGDYLAEYNVETITVDLSDDEKRAYTEARSIYRAFIVRRGIQMGTQNGCRLLTLFGSEAFNAQSTARVCSTRQRFYEPVYHPGIGRKAVRLGHRGIHPRACKARRSAEIRARYGQSGGRGTRGKR